MWNTVIMTHSDFAAAITAVIRSEAAVQQMGAADLARAAGVPYPTLWRYLKDEREITLTATEKIARALGKPVSWITGRAETRIADAALEAHVRAATGDEEAVSGLRDALARDTSLEEAGDEPPGGGQRAG
jgi:AcrR family transcriptional regulator